MLVDFLFLLELWSYRVGFSNWSGFVEGVVGWLVLVLIVLCVTMSGGTPTGGYMRQRHSQGYASSGDDLEDDACSVMHSSTGSSPRVWSKREIAENVMWLVSAAGIVYLGDSKSNLIFLLWHDDRIRRYTILCYVWLIRSTCFCFISNYSGFMLC